MRAIPRQFSFLSISGFYTLPGSSSAVYAGRITRRRKCYALATGVVYVYVYGTAAAAVFGPRVLPNASYETRPLKLTRRSLCHFTLLAVCNCIPARVHFECVYTTRDVRIRFLHYIELKENRSQGGFVSP